MKSTSQGFIFTAAMLLYCLCSHSQTIDLTTKDKVIYKEDFETDNHGWSTSNGVWEVGRPTSGPSKAQSGSNCAATILSGNYPANTDSRFYSSYIEMPKRQNDQEQLLLSFWEWHNYSNRYTYASSKDKTYVQINNLNNKNWINLKTEYNFDSGCWSNTIIDISNYFGNTIQIAFYHDDNDDGGQQGYGQYIDNIEIRVESPRSEDLSTDIPFHWKQIALGGPLPRRDASIIFDSLRNRILLFGGRSDTENFGDILARTGAGDSAKWTQIMATGPSPRFGAAMGYDINRDRVVLFGGSNGSLLSDTWEWDGEQWIDVTPENSPSRRVNAAIAYDSYRNRILLFGGADGTTRFGDTWEWDGTTWTQKTINGPSPRSECGMAYDEERQTTVLFGGHDNGNYYNDTWEYKGLVWKKIDTDSGPSARTSQSSLAYDCLRRRVVLFGGASETGALGDTWEFDGTTWFKTADTGPYPRTGGAIAYDSSRERTVLFGGANPFEDANMLGDTWEYSAGDMLSVDWQSPMESFAEFVPIPGGFDSYPAGMITVDQFPEEIGPFPNAYTDGKGVIFDMNRGQVYLLMFPTMEVGDYTVLIRASVRATAPGAAIALAALDPSDNSISTNIPNNSQIFTSDFSRIVITFDPPGSQVSPIFQVSNIGNDEPVTVYMDNIEVILLPRDKNRSIYGNAPNTDMANVIEIVYKEDFEADNHGWSASNGVWEVGQPTSGPNKTHIGVNCAATVLAGNYPLATDSRFSSPLIILPQRVSDLLKKIYHKKQEISCSDIHKLLR